MKTIIILLSIYFLFLSAFPCAGDCESLELVKEVQTQSTEHSDESCNLFCSCNCSGTIISISNASSNIGIAYLHSITFSSYSEYPISQYYHSVWQPPKQA